MSEEALIHRDDSALTISFTPQAIALRDAAMDMALRVSKVDNADTNQSAVDVQTEIARVLKLAEEARVAAKAPVLDFGRRIDDSAKQFVEELKKEQWRISRLCGDFQQLEQAKARAAQQAENERLDALERQRKAELAKAQSHDELDAIQQKFDTRVQQEQPKPVAPIRAEGQVVKEDIEFDVFDIDALYRSKPSCVKMEPKKVEIKSLLKAGIQLPGVRSWKTTNATIRTGRSQQAIDV